MPASVGCGSDQFRLISQRTSGLEEASPRERLFNLSYRMEAARV